MDNKSIFAKNLNKYMKLKGKTRKNLCEDLGFSYYTVSDWVNGKKYPRMDKVEILAEYFGILKSDLIEEKSDDHRKMQEKNDILADVIVRMRTDEDFLSLVETLNTLNAEQLQSVKMLMSAFVK